MADRYHHIFLSGNQKSEKYKASPKPGRQPAIPIRDRASHSAKLLKQFDNIWREKERLNQNRSAEGIPTREGTYLSFTSAANNDLITKSLENVKKGIRLLNIKEEAVADDQKITRATIYVPNGMEGYFINKIVKYQEENLKSGKPKNAPLVNSIEDISTALLEGLWTDNLNLIPASKSKWCEVWLNVNTQAKKEKEQINSFITLLEKNQVEHKKNTIIFPERAIVLINANRDQLVELMIQSDLLAEIRSCPELASFWIKENTFEQQAWIDDLLKRIEVQDNKVKICLLDSGVNNGHQLLRPILIDEDTLTVDPTWGTNDHESGSGHGTLMAGIAGYGSLQDTFLSREKVVMSHSLCSVKVLPPPTKDPTPKELWGDITAQGISRAEIKNPNVNLIYCLSVTSKEDSIKGRPSSWSGEIDNLTYGEGNAQRIVIISAGNIRDEEFWKDYPNSNFVTSIENPAQSWNGLTIGAFTEKVRIEDDRYKEYSALAKEGELSPFSTTSLSWERKWPVKPDVVFEGGNLIKSPTNLIEPNRDLEILSTSKLVGLKNFDTINATSAAAAQAAWLTAKIVSEYPEAWPETVRGLIVHSASWKEGMLKQLNVKEGSRSDHGNLLRVFGFGVPDIERAIYSKESALTFVAQESIQPFSIDENGQPETNEIHIFNFPWPKDLLLSLGSIPVKLKVTLSYYIEPGAGEIGWKDKYRYQSHGLRFDINNINETETDFRRRINLAARESDEEITTVSGSRRWVIGTNNRSQGSLHSDYWQGTAADLATCNLIAVYPVIGWWRERKHLNKVENKTRYSLILSLDTPAEEVELYSTVKALIEIPIEIKTTIS